LLNAYTNGPNGCILGRLLICSDAILTAYRRRWALALMRLAWIRTVLSVSWISSWRLKSVVVGRPSRGTQNSFSSTLFRVLMLCCVLYLIERFVGIIVAAALMIRCFPQWSGCCSLCWSSLWSCCSLWGCRSLYFSIGGLSGHSRSSFRGRHCCCCFDDVLLPTMELSLRTLLPGAVSADATPRSCLCGRCSLYSTIRGLSGHSRSSLRGRHYCCCFDVVLLPTMELSLRTLLPGAVSADAAPSV
jgi:hypothetical protein